MKIPAFISTLFKVAEFNDLDLNDVLLSLNDPMIRKHWLWAMAEEIKQIHQRVHVYLIHGKLEEKFIVESAKLQGIEWALRQVIASKTSIGLDRQNHVKDELEDMAVQLV